MKVRRKEMKRRLSITAMTLLVGFSALSMLPCMHDAFIQVYTRSDANSKYRQITLDNSRNPETLTDYQVLLNVTYDSDMQSDFDDLRFTWHNEASGEEVDIDYWMDKYVDSEYALVWVEVPEITGSGEEVLDMHFGDLDAVSGSNGHETFVFFDDFSTDTTANYEISRNQKGEISWDANGWLLLNASVLEDPGRSANVMVRHKTAQINETEENYWVETNGKAFRNGVLDYFGVMKEYKHVPPHHYPNAYAASAKIYGVPSNSCRLHSTWETIGEFDENAPLPTSAKSKWYRIGLGTSSNGTLIGKFYDNDYREIAVLANHTIHYQNEWRVSLVGSKHRELAYPTDLCVYFDYVRVRKFTDSEPTYSVGSEQQMDTLPFWMEWWPWIIVLPLTIACIFALSTIHFYRRSRIGKESIKPTSAQQTLTEEHKVCPKCGAKLPKDAVFCGKCGTEPR